MDETSIRTAVSWAATSLSFLQNLAGIPLLRQVVKEGDSTPFTKAPMWLMTATTLLIGQYAVLEVYAKNQVLDGLIFSNFVCLVFWWVSLGVFINYAPTNRYRLQLVGTYLAICTVCVLFAQGLYTFPPHEVPG